MKKNVAGQTVGAQMVSATDGSAFTSAVTVYVTGDAGTQAAGSVGAGACTHEGNGFHTYAPAQAETNYDHVAFTFVGTGAVSQSVQVWPNFPQTGDSFARLGAPAGASHAADVAAVQADTDNIQTRIPAALTADGNIKADTLRVSGTLQTAGDLAAMLTIIDDFLDTEIAQILGDTTTDIPTQIAALNNLSAAQVKTQITDALNVDTYAQPGQGAPAATTTMRLMLAYLYKFARNKRDNDGSTTNFYNDDAATVDHKQSTAESGGTVTVGEMATGP